MLDIRETGSSHIRRVYSILGCHSDGSDIWEPPKMRRLLSHSHVWIQTQEVLQPFCCRLSSLCGCDNNAKCAVSDQDQMCGWDTVHQMKRINRTVWNPLSAKPSPPACKKHTLCLRSIFGWSDTIWNGMLKSWSNTSRFKRKKQVFHWGLGCQIPLTAFVCNFTWCALQCHIFLWYIICSIQINIHANTDMMDEPWKEWKVINTSDISSWGDASRNPTSNS